MHDTHLQRPFEMSVRVYYEDTDAGGVVYYANYLKFFERCRTEWLRHLGIEQLQYAEQARRLFVVKNVEIQYRKPARLDDLIDISSSITQLGKASITFHQTALRCGETLCESSIVVCSVNADTFRPAPFTPELRTLLEKAKR